MIDFLNRLFGRRPSSATAKERLRLVLMSDHLSLAPELVDAMKQDLVDVISRYVEVDRTRIEVNFEHQDRALALLANIPILSVARKTAGSDGATLAPAQPEPAVTPAPAAIVGETSGVQSEPEAVPPVVEPPASAPAGPLGATVAMASPPGPVAAAPNATASKPKRRRKKQNGASARPAAAS